MNINPEFQRYVWLEFSPHRLIGMPMVLGAIFFLTYVVSGSDASVTMVAVSSWTFGILLYIWGTRLASEAVIEEVLERTWDTQRMSSIGPWPMTWGKIFGSAVYTWYGGGICLLVYIIAALDVIPSDTLIKSLCLLLGCAFLSHSVGLLTSLQALQKKYLTTRRGTAGYSFVGIIAMLPFLVLGITDESGSGANVVSWYGASYGRLNFVLSSLAVFTAWSFLGVYRMMRTELQIRNAPWTWLGFLIFIMGYVSGFISDPGIPIVDSVYGLKTGDILSARFFVSFVIGLTTVYLLALSEPKNPVVFRKMAQFAKVGEWSRLLEIAPRWLLTIPVVFVVGIGTVIYLPGVLESERTSIHGGAFIAALFLFMVRDVGILVFLNLARSQRRADLATIIYLFVLYLLVPGILKGMGISAMNSFFLPRWDVNFVAATLPVILEIGLVYFLLMRRWRNHYYSSPS